MSSRACRCATAIVVLVACAPRAPIVQPPSPSPPVAALRDGDERTITAVRGSARPQELGMHFDLHVDVTGSGDVVRVELANRYYLARGDVAISRAGRKLETRVSDDDVIAVLDPDARNLGQITLDVAYTMDDLRWQDGTIVLPSNAAWLPASGNRPRELAVTLELPTNTTIVTSSTRATIAGSRISLTDLRAGVPLVVATVGRTRRAATIGAIPVELWLRPSTLSREQLLLHDLERALTEVGAPTRPKLIVIELENSMTAASTVDTPTLCFDPRDSLDVALVAETWLAASAEPALARDDTNVVGWRQVVAELVALRIAHDPREHRRAILTEPQPAELIALALTSALAPSVLDAAVRELVARNGPTADLEPLYRAITQSAPGLRPALEHLQQGRQALPAYSLDHVSRDGARLTGTIHATGQLPEPPVLRTLTLTALKLGETGWTTVATTRVLIDGPTTTWTLAASDAELVTLDPEMTSLRVVDDAAPTTVPAVARCERQPPGPTLVTPPADVLARALAAPPTTVRRHTRIELDVARGMAAVTNTITIRPRASVVEMTIAPAAFDIVAKANDRTLKTVPRKEALLVEVPSVRELTLEVSYRVDLRDPSDKNHRSFDPLAPEYVSAPYLGASTPAPGLLWPITVVHPAYLTPISAGPVGLVVTTTSGARETTFPQGTPSVFFAHAWNVQRSRKAKVEIWSPAPLPMATPESLAVVEHAVASLAPFGVRPVLSRIVETGRAFGINVGFGLIVLKNVATTAHTVRHEVAHQWFGNLVYWDHAETDAKSHEALASYAAYIGASPEEAHDQRAKTATAVAREASAADAQPVIGFDPATPAEHANILAYKRGTQILDMLALRIGDDRMVAMLRRFIADNTGRRVGWRALLSAIGRTEGTDVETWTRTWLTRAGAPDLAIGSVVRQGVDVAITLVQSGAPWPVVTEVIGLDDAGTIVARKIVEMTGATTTLRLRGPRLRMIIVDPEHRTPRRSRDPDDETDDLRAAIPN